MVNVSTNIEINLFIMGMGMRAFLECGGLSPLWYFVPPAGT